MPFSRIQLAVGAIRPNGLGNLDIELIAPDGSELPAFEAGAHIDVVTPSGVTRQYSLCNGPGERHHYHLCVRLDLQSRGGSVSMHRTLAVGDRLEVSVPRNHFQLPDVQSYLLFAGGIGITPILAMARALAASGANFEFHYYVQSRERAAFVDFLEECAFSTRVFLHMSNQGDSLRYRIPDCFTHPGTNAAILACGPEGFIARLQDTAMQKGWTEAQFHSERFRPVERTVEKSTGAFEVRLVSSGRLFFVSENETIASVLLRNGIGVEVSCEQGICGACLTPVIEGDPDHRDTVLSSAEKLAKNQMAICCSRSHSRVLVLDL